jgi:hypothetical protein
VFSTVVTGNSGSWLATSGNGRYTPPAGRYNLYATASFYTNSGTFTANVSIRKNGAVVGVGPGSTSTGATLSQAVSDVIVDANGTDWFDVQFSTHVTGSGTNSFFGAFPLTGLAGPTGTAGPPGPAGGKLIQSTSVETGAVATGTTILPADDTIPQINEGDQYMTCVITPQSSSSKLIINVTWMGSSTITPGQMVVALFQDATANALAAVALHPAFVNAGVVVSFTHVMVAGTTSATTFRVRAGANASGTTTFNGQTSGRTLGGVAASSITIREESP